ncbi:MAG: peptidoglycan editing factor PgeF [Magnetococcales bacterium]|nr:peptidoglycan editing factor PgeF [Magnetococcales bacterium]
MKKTHHSCRSSEETQENILLLRGKNFPPLEGVDHFFTTRQGGVSTGNYASLNLGGHVNDHPEAVARNRALLMAALGPQAQELALVNQVHGDRAVVAGMEGAYPDADAVVTDRPGVVVGVLTADCVPVLFADCQGRVVGAAHAGWRGALAGILDNTLALMETLGARRERIVAIVGPCIHAASYEVDAPFRDRFLQGTDNKINQAYQKFFSNRAQSGILTFDLPGYVHGRLIENGLDALKIFNLEQCTYALDSLFFSHRRATHRGALPCGRQLGGIHLLP